MTFLFARWKSDSLLNGSCGGSLNTTLKRKRRLRRTTEFHAQAHSLQKCRCWRVRTSDSLQYLVVSSERCFLLYRDYLLVRMTMMTWKWDGRYAAPTNSHTFISTKWNTVFFSMPFGSSFAQHQQSSINSNTKHHSAASCHSTVAVTIGMRVHVKTEWQSHTPISSCYSFANAKWAKKKRITFPFIHGMHHHHSHECNC